MKINQLNEAIIRKQIREDQTYKNFYAIGILLKEYNMTQQQVQSLFQQVAQGAAAGGNVDREGDAPVSNRTMLGKGADVAGKVRDAYRGLKDAIGKTGPVKGIDAFIDSAQTQIMQAAGGESGKVGQALEFYRELSKVPGMAMAVKVAVLGLAGLAGSGLGPVGIAAGLSFANKMLQGDKFSSAVIGAMETGGTVQAIHVAKDLLATNVGADYGNADDQSFGTLDRPGMVTGQNLDNYPAGDNTQFANTYGDNGYGGPVDQGEVPAADSLSQGEELVPNDASAINPMDPNAWNDGTQTDFATDALNSYTVMPGETLSQIAQAHGVSVADLKGLNPEITNPDDIRAGMTINIPPENGSDVYAGGTGTAADTANQIARGNYTASPNSMSQAQADAISDRAGNLARMQQQAGGTAPIRTQADLDNYVQQNIDAGRTPTGNGGVGPDTPSDGSYRQAAPLGRDGKPMQLMKEYVDTRLTARMWLLHESMGKPRGGVYITNEGVQAIFAEVARRSVVTEGPMLDKLKAFNQRAGNAIGKFTAPIKQAAAAGWDSATNKITARDLDINWRRSAKLDKEASVDSQQVINFLKQQGVKDPLINASFKALNIPMTGDQPGGQAGMAQKPTDYSLKDTGYDATTMFKNMSTSMRGPKAGKRIPSPSSVPTAEPAVATPTTTATTTTTTVPAAKTRTGGKVAGQLSTNPRAVARRDANAAKKAATTTAGGAGAFGQMAANLAARPTASSTGGTTTGVAGVGNGVVRHTANPNNPNLKPTPTATTTATPTATDVWAGDPNKATAKKAPTKKSPAASAFGNMAASLEENKQFTRDFGAMLWTKMRDGK